MCSHDFSCALGLDQAIGETHGRRVEYIMEESQRTCESGLLQKNDLGITLPCWHELRFEDDWLIDMHSVWPEDVAVNLAQTCHMRN